MAPPAFRDVDQQQRPRVVPSARVAMTTGGQTDFACPLVQASPPKLDPGRISEDANLGCDFEECFQACSAAASVPEVAVVPSHAAHGVQVGASDRRLARARGDFQKFRLSQFLNCERRPATATVPQPRHHIATIAKVISGNETNEGPGVFLLLVEAADAHSLRTLLRTTDATCSPKRIVAARPPGVGSSHNPSATSRASKSTTRRRTSEAVQSSRSNRRRGGGGV
jgi:hypothetical protein